MVVADALDHRVRVGRDRAVASRYGGDVLGQRLGAGVDHDLAVDGGADDGRGDGDGDAVGGHRPDRPLLAVADQVGPGAHLVDGRDRGRELRWASSRR